MNQDFQIRHESKHYRPCNQYKHHFHYSHHRSLLDGRSVKRIFFLDDVGEEVEKLFYFQVFVVKEWANFSKVKRVTLMCSNLLRGKPTMSGRVFCLPFWLFLTDFFTPLMRSLFKIDVMGCQIILKVLFCLDLHWSPLTTNKSVGWGRLPLPPRRLK